MIFRNSIAHLAARVLSLLAGLISIPLVGLTLGTEALGLVGVYLTLQGIFSLFDLGLPAAVNQRLALLGSRNTPPRERAELVRTLEVLFLMMAVVFVAAGVFAKAPIATSWLKAQVLSPAVIDNALNLIIVSVAIRFPIGFYSNVHFGLNRHVYANAVIAFSAFLRIVLPLIALTQFAVGIVGYFAILLALNTVEIALLFVGAWRRVSHAAAFPRWSRLEEIGHTAALLGLVSLASVATTQVDKVLLSSQLTLGDFGVYTAAYALAGGLLALSYPVSNALFPQLVQQMDRRDDAGARIAVRLGTEMTTLFLVPIAAVAVLQAPALLDLLFLFRNVPPNLDHILPLMMVGALAQGFVTLPHMFQVAALRTKYVLFLNLILLPPYAVLIFLAAKYYGVQGAAMAFMAFNLTHLAAHWLLLFGNRRTAAIWRPIPAVIVAGAVGGFAVAGASTFVSLPRYLSSLPALTAMAAIAVLIAVSMPRLRAALRERLSR